MSWNFLSFFQRVCLLFWLLNTNLLLLFICIYFLWLFIFLLWIINYPCVQTGSVPEGCRQCHAQADCVQGDCLCKAGFQGNGTFCSALPRECFITKAWDDESLFHKTVVTLVEVASYSEVITIKKHYMLIKDKFPDRSTDF